MALKNRVKHLEKKSNGYSGTRIVIGKENQTEQQAKEEYCKTHGLDIDNETLVFICYEDLLTC